MRYSPTSKSFSLIRLASHDFLLARYNYPEQLYSIYDVIIVRPHRKSPMNLINHTETLHKGKRKTLGPWTALKDIPPQVHTYFSNHDGQTYYTQELTMRSSGGGVKTFLSSYL